MGCRHSKHAGQRAQINVFSDVDPSKDSSATEIVERQNSLSDAYSFEELDKLVFNVGQDYVFNDKAGLVCGRLTSTGVYEGCFGQKYLHLSLMTIKSNGKVFLQDSVNRSIGQFDGKVMLSEIDVRPILPKEKKRLSERGRQFAKYGLGSHYKVYSDKMFIRGCLGVCEMSAEGRVMVDTSSFLHFHPNYAALSHARGLVMPGEDDFGDYCNSSSQQFSLEIPDPSLHLCWPTLCGFSLKTKRWGEMAVDKISEISFSDDAFDKLVLDPKLKEMVKSLVGNVHKEMFTDIIQGKGGGCVFLLHGPPGCGKTLTSEAVSEILHRPLYCVDVGELGITPNEVEDRLKKILEVAERWNAVVLIDECDIFLASRSNDDVLRNAIVGIFLRLLEYYNGVLFLTSNRADDLDEAFESRISISLEYKMLDKKSRKQVWNNLLEAAGISGLDAEQLAEYQLNGRQIKTAIRLALSLAKTANEAVEQKHMIQTISFANVKESTSHDKGDDV